VENGEVVEIEKEMNGWGWGRKIASDESGWIPLEILSRLV